MSGVMRFAFLRDHFRCSMESGLGGQEAIAVMRGDREGMDKLRDSGSELTELGD